MRGIFVCPGIAGAKAFQAANRLKEPKAKIVALDWFLQEYPSSTRAATARRELILASADVNPKDAVRRAKQLTQSLPAADAAELNRFLAAELNTRKKLPKEAERAAREALQQLTYEAFAAQQKDPPPSRARYDVQRARMNETLAQALAARGNTKQAMPVFMEALKANPSLGTSAIAVGDILSREGKSAKALPYFAQGMLARSTPESRKKFGEAYLEVKGHRVRFRRVPG